MYNLSTVLESSARERPQHTAFILGDRRFSYAEINAAANMIANGLAANGIGAGDTVALSCPNLPFFPMIYFGVLKTGATILPVNVLLTPDEIAYLLKDSGAKAYFCFEGTADLPMGKSGHAAFGRVDTCEHFWVITADPAAASPINHTPTLGALMAGRAPRFDTVQRQGDDVAVVLYTSGTTGHPKGAELTHTNILLNAMISRELVKSESDDVCMLTLPLFHVFGQVVLMVACTMVGTTMVLVPRFEPGAVLKSFRRCADHVLGVAQPPGRWRRPRQDQEHVAHLRLRRCVAAGRGAARV
jgi:long-chain acyl-CoA synthetase